MADLNIFIKKSHLKALDKFKEELEAFRKETGEEVAVLYEDPFTSFKLGDIKVENGILSYRYDDGSSHERVVLRDPDTRKYYEVDYMDGIMDFIKFWRKCLRRAKRYWAMDPDLIDKIQDGEIEDKEEEDEA